jgi:hypothetical protein
LEPIAELRPRALVATTTFSIFVWYDEPVETESASLTVAMFARSYVCPQAAGREELTAFSRYFM